MNPAIIPALAVLLGTCVACDLRWRRVPNVVTGPGILVGTGLGVATGGIAGFVSSVEGLGLALLILLAPFALGGIGGGDVKMMGAVGTFVGPRLLVAGLAIGLILGGIIAAAVALRRGRLGATLRRVGHMASTAIVTRSIDPLRARPDEHSIALPYSIPLALGTLVAVGHAIVREG